MASVRMFSNRTLNTECGNGENLQGACGSGWGGQLEHTARIVTSSPSKSKGRDLADGVMNVYLDGTEFEDVYPMWDWHLVPGTTEHQTGTAYTCSGVRDVTSTAWVGGVSDGMYGASTMDFVRGHQYTMYMQQVCMCVCVRVCVFRSPFLSFPADVVLPRRCDHRRQDEPY